MSMKWKLWQIFQWLSVLLYLVGNAFSAKSYFHYSDVIIGAIVSQITSLTVVYSTVDWGTDRRKLQSSASLAFVRGINRSPVNSPHKGPVTPKSFPFDDVIMCSTLTRGRPRMLHVHKEKADNCEHCIYSYSLLHWKKVYQWIIMSLS